MITQVNKICINIYLNCSQEQLIIFMISFFSFFANIKIVHKKIKLVFKGTINEVWDGRGGEDIF